MPKRNKFFYYQRSLKYECTLCDYRVSSKLGLKFHMEKTHGGKLLLQDKKIITCEGCHQQNRCFCAGRN